MGAADRVDCPFMYVSFLLCAVYLGLLAFVCRYLMRLFKREDKRRAQKFFLALVVFQCVGRSIYFLAWPITGATCDPTLTSATFSALDVAGTLPAAFFISAFSVLVFTFARIYHCILRHNTIPQQRLFTALAVFLVGMNVAVYTSTVLEFFSTAATSRFVPDDLEPLMLSVVCFVVALLFLLYGTLLYLECQRVIREASATPQQSHGVAGPKFSSDSNAAAAAGGVSKSGSSSHLHSSSSQQVGEVASALGRSTGLAPPATPSPPGTNNAEQAPTVQPNPMRKIAIIAAICTVCLTVRTVLIPVVDAFGGSFIWPVLLVYLFFAEILPLILMLKVFDTSAAGRAGVGGGGLAAPLLGDGALADENNADRRFGDGRLPGASENDVNVSITPTQSPKVGGHHHSSHANHFNSNPNSHAALPPAQPHVQQPHHTPQRQQQPAYEHGSLASHHPVTNASALPPNSSMLGSNSGVHSGGSSPAATHVSGAGAAAAGSRHASNDPHQSFRSDPHQSFRFAPSDKLAELRFG